MPFVVIVEGKKSVFVMDHLIQKYHAFGTVLMVNLTRASVIRQTMTGECYDQQGEIFSKAQNSLKLKPLLSSYNNFFNISQNDVI